MFKNILEILGIEGASHILEFIIGLFPFAFTWILAYAIVVSLLHKLGEFICVDGQTPNPDFSQKLEIITALIAGGISFFIAIKIMSWDGWI